MRNVNIAKGNFRFAPVLYLDSALKSIDTMPLDNFDHIIEKYVEMNVAHPFREGNDRSTRIWLDAILKKELDMVIDWSQVDKEDYLFAMTTKVNDRQVYMKGIDASYNYEGYSTYKTEDC